ncbi:hypothetical protein SUGI_0310840 [Cryptomeria japonica]|uniref:trihelix transcription factor ENAP1 n=1 Tax=Cryptomeria japonica TaxID=3369 RepID=UPI0024089522|nr:trihelix transcription factor ENAP1 [Cryptomeria japonica]GLJ17792.1 hypothetical protein SUGI_0310840 [Cryptomeria japonica]
MEDTDDDARYPSAVQYHHSSYNTTNNPFHRPKLPLRMHHDTAPAFTDEEDDEEQDDNDYGEEGDDDESENGFPKPRQPKEFDGKAAFDRFGVRNVSPILFPKPEYQPKGFRDDWSEAATIILLETWAEKFSQMGKTSLKLEQWAEISQRVSVGSKTHKTDVQCRNRLERLKKKYKKEKQKQNAAAASSGVFVSKWAYFRHMDSILSSSSWQVGLPCGIDAGEFVFLNPRVYLNQTTFDEVRDSPTEDDDAEDDDNDYDDEEGDRRVKRRKDGDDREDSFRVLADSIKTFGEIYERIENNKKQQMLDLEKMRMEIDRDLEMQKSQILEETKVALAKIRQGNDDIDASVTNMSS